LVSLPRKSRMNLFFGAVRSGAVGRLVRPLLGCGSSGLLPKQRFGAFDVVWRCSVSVHDAMER